MVMIVIETWYPPKAAQIVAQKYLELMQKPLDKSLGETVLSPIVQLTKEGVHTISVLKCRDDKIKECMLAMAKYMLAFAGIEGYHYSIDNYADITEAMTTLGMKGPQ
jgi:hypothetical protein